MGNSNTDGPVIRSVFQCGNCDKWYDADDYALPVQNHQGRLVPMCAVCFSGGKRPQPLDPDLWAGLSSVVKVSETENGLLVEGVFN